MDAEAADIAGQPQLAERYSTLQEPGSDTGSLTLLDLITNLAVHNAYHLGRIVQLRPDVRKLATPGWRRHLVRSD